MYVESGRAFEGASGECLQSATPKAGGKLVATGVIARLIGHGARIRAKAGTYDEGRTDRSD